MQKGTVMSDILPEEYRIELNSDDKLNVTIKDLFHLWHEAMVQFQQGLEKEHGLKDITIDASEPNKKFKSIIISFQSQQKDETN